jgi:hypothetical protein
MGLSGNKSYVKYHSFHNLSVLEVPYPECGMNATMKLDALIDQIHKTGFQYVIFPSTFLSDNIFQNRI